MRDCSKQSGQHENDKTKKENARRTPAYTRVPPFYTGGSRAVVAVMVVLVVVVVVFMLCCRSNMTLINFPLLFMS